MKKDIIYENEKLNCKPILVGSIIVCIFVILISFRPLSSNFDVKGFLVTICFMLFFYLIMFLIFCLGDILKFKKFKKYKEEFVKNGIKLKGTIIESEQEVALWVNNIPTKYRYVAIIKVENGDVFRTPYLVINPKKCKTQDVIVYQEDDNYFATKFDYDFNQEKKKTKKENFEYIHSNDFNIPSKKQSIITLLMSVILCYIFIYLLLISADNITRLIMTPFCIAGIGVFLQGLLPLIMVDKILAVKISKRVYMAGFLLYIFGFLILWDYFALRDGQVNLFILSLIFWAVGIYLIKRWFFTNINS